MMRNTVGILFFLFCFLAAAQYVGLNTLYRAQMKALGALPGSKSALDALAQNSGTLFFLGLGICAFCLAFVSLYMAGSYLRMKSVWTEHYAEMAAKEQELSMERDRIDGAYEDLRRMGTLTSHAGMHNQNSVMQWLDVNFGSFYRASVENLLDGERSTAILFLALDDVDALYSAGQGKALVDAILVEMSQQLEQWIRQNDLVARWQDASFMLVMTYISLKDALLRAEDFRTALVDSALNIHGVEINVSISCGLSMMLSSDSSWRQAMERAKKALSHRQVRGQNTLYHEIL
jgi:diguanylate cyclase (GGDEF)-like protein